ncbi:MAG: hypothetical protein ACHQT8_03830 [Chlamydiales bacterium]
MPESAHEQSRLKESATTAVPPWQKWGPYVSERAWGTVREDYSWNGDAWTYFPFDDAHKRTYRWGEDGIAGWCDRYQVLAFAPAFWNGQDPILKERLFGLTSLQGNHGEDVKECYYYLDGTPTHSYMKYLYKYPQRAFPYKELKDVNARRGTKEPEYELVDTGIFSENRYFDIFIEYAKVTPEDLCIRIEAVNRAQESAPLDIIPQLWFRNQWGWGDVRLPEPLITKDPKSVCLVADDTSLLSPSTLAFDYHLGKRYLYGSEGGRALFTNNETFSSDVAYYKDGFHNAIIHKQQTVNPECKGTKACLHYHFEKIEPGKSVILEFRFSDKPLENPLQDVEKLVLQRRSEADAFYTSIHPKHSSAEEKQIQRQALAGMLWNKQIYLFDVNLWLQGDNTYAPPPPSRAGIRNVHWHHLNSMRILSMPDKWEYPWFAAWDLAFHCLTFSLVDIEFAKEQLWLLLFDQFQHPNGAIPAYEWEFSDLNPPIQSWVALRLYQIQREKEGIEDRAFLKKCFLKLIINFAWWVNRVDSTGLNVFEGGFLGLDNITIVDRSLDFEGGATLRQSDGTGWMALFCLNLMRIALELAKEDKTYEAMATKFFQHFIYIAHAMKVRGNQKYELWSEKDGFFYDVLTYPDGQFAKFRVRSLVGIIPLYATEIITEEELDQFPEFKRNFLWFLKNRKVHTKDCVLPFTDKTSKNYLLTLVNQQQLQSVLKYVWDPAEFRSPFGLRSLSKIHETNPFFYKDRQISYEPGEAISRLKGGNSNWRGPLWFPTTYLLLQSLKTFSSVYKENLKISVKEEKPVTIDEMIRYFESHMINLFKKNAQGVRPSMGENHPFAKDPNFVEFIHFFEFFHGETGKGLGASHQTGWSGLVANMIQELEEKK